MVDHSIKFGDYDMTEIVEEIDDGSNTRINAQSVGKRHGAFISSEPVLEPRKIKIRGTLYSSDGTKETLRDQIRELAKELGFERKRLKVFADRYWNAYKGQFSHAYIPGTALLVARFSVEFFCDDPFEYEDPDPAATEVILTSGDDPIDPSSNLYGKDFTLDNDGDLFSYLKVTVTADQGNAVTQAIIRNQTEGVLEQYTGTIGIGNSLVIDNGIFSVKNNGVEDLANWAGTFLWIDPGTNNFRIEGEPATYSFEYKKRWF